MFNLATFSLSSLAFAAHLLIFPLPIIMPEGPEDKGSEHAIVNGKGSGIPIREFENLRCECFRVPPCS